MREPTRPPIPRLTGEVVRCVSAQRTTAFDFLPECTSRCDVSVRIAEEEWERATVFGLQYQRLSNQRKPFVIDQFDCPGDRLHAFSSCHSTVKGSRRMDLLPDRQVVASLTDRPSVFA